MAVNAQNRSLGVWVGDSNEVQVVDAGFYMRSPIGRVKKVADKSQ